MPDFLFQDRRDAARQLVPLLASYKGDPDAVLLAIPRGALEIGAVLRDALKIPLDVVVTKKIPAPGNEEYAIGAVAPDGSVEIDRSILDWYTIPQGYVESEARRLQEIIRRRYEEYRGSPTPPQLKGKIAIVLDDGLATGFTAQVAVHYLRKQGPRKIVLAVPVASPEAYARLKTEADEIVCLKIPREFYAVGQFYREFNQVEDEEAKRLLRMVGSAKMAKGTAT